MDQNTLLMDNVKVVQCYELFGGIALKNHTFFIFFLMDNVCCEYDDQKVVKAHAAQFI